MDISKWAFRNRNLIYFLIAVLLLGGVLLLSDEQIGRPRNKSEACQVVTTYPGASVATR